MELKIKVKRAVLLIHTGATNKLMLTMDIPSNFPGSNECPVMSMELATTLGEDYIINNFGISPEIIDLKQ